MTTTPRWVRRASARDLHYFQHPALWVRYPFLPVTRQAVGETKRQLGLLCDLRGVAGIYGFRTTVFLTNLFSAPKTVPDLFTLPRCVYDTVDELADGGWVVD